MVAGSWTARVKPRSFLFIGLVAASIAAGFLLRPHLQNEQENGAVDGSASPGPVVSSATQPTEPRPAPPLEPPFGERILSDYGTATRTPEHDLEAVARTLGNLALLVKGDNPLPLGANEEIAAALRGKNRAKLAAVSDDHRIFNARGQIVDRWDTPLYFHAASRDRLEIRSAGPDRQMWTADDLHRLPDGRFTRGEALLPRSLFEEKSIAR